VTFYHDNPESELINKSCVDGLLHKLRDWHGRQLNQSGVALVAGSAVWDLLSPDTVDPDFFSHLKGARQYAKRLQQEYPPECCALLEISFGLPSPPAAGRSLP
jgi:hypothetical protein